MVHLQKLILVQSVNETAESWFLEIVLQLVRQNNKCTKL